MNNETTFTTLLPETSLILPEKSHMKRQMKTIHPGKILFEEVIVPNNFSIDEAADILGISLADLSSVAKGEAPISPALAGSISRKFGGSAELWLRLQNAFDSNQQS